jgi:hypothetical protein
MSLATLRAVTEEMSARLTMSRLRTRGNRPCDRAFRSRCQKGNLGYLAIIRRCAIVEAEFEIVAAVGLPSKKE